MDFHRATRITLAALRARDIEAFYNSQLNRVKGKTVVKYHANIHSALKYAVRMELIPSNPADNVDRPKMEQFTGGFCDADEMGDRIKPDYISATFQTVLKRHKLKKVRFHDLRHSCASLLLANGVSMKQIQEWLGHSDFSTTANVYTHLAFDSKLSSADALNLGTAFGRLTQSAAIPAH